VVAALCPFLAACALLFPARDPFSESAAPSIRVDVENQNFYDATIWVTPDGGIQRRVGSVVGNGRGSFEVPMETTVGVIFRIELLADGWCTTYPVTVSPGDALELEIQPTFPSAVYCQAAGGGTARE
jgi:hypothetical protein